MNHHRSPDETCRNTQPNPVHHCSTGEVTAAAAVFFLSGDPLPLPARHLFAAVFISLFASINAAWCQVPASYSRSFTQRLTEPHTGLVQGQSFRRAVQVVARGSHRNSDDVNIWIDRKVNPSAPVYPDSLGPTRFESLCKIADSAGCVCYPIENCVLIGRATWVAELSRRIRSKNDTSVPSSSASTRSVRSDFRWPDLTTPQQALAQIDPERAGRSPESSGETLPKLPHDLWPATKLIDLSPELAKILVVGQFIDVDQLSGSTADSSAPDPRFQARYRSVRQSDVLASAQTIDPESTARAESGSVVLNATQAAHQFVCRHVFGRSDDAAASQLAGGDGPSDRKADALERLKTNSRTFSLTVDDVPAGTIIESLVGQIGIRCEMDRANPSLAKIVPIKAEDQTVWQLVRLIASKASLKILAAGDKIRVVARADD